MPVRSPEYVVHSSESGFRMSAGLRPPVSGAGGGGGGGRGGGGGGNPATVTLTDNSKLEGTLVRKDDFLVILMLDDGTRKSIARSGVQKIEVNDPREAHKSMAMKLIFDDPDNKKMHDVTAYLASIK